MAKFTPLDRRTFLRGAGVALALPMLEGMRPSLATASGSAISGVTNAATASPVRLAWVFFPNGTNYKKWKPEGEGRDWRPSSTLQAVQSVRDDLLVVTGLAHGNARSLGDGAGDHARSAATFLTGAHPVKTHGAGIRAGVSADQVAAEAIGHGTRLASMELGAEHGRSSGQCDSGYSCAYTNNISWRSATQPTAKEVNPRLAFERLVGGLGGERKDANRRQAEKRSVLDIISDQARSLEGRLGGADRRKLEEYFESVREVERRIEHLAANDHDTEASASLADLQAPAGKPESLTERIRSMYDLMVLAFQTDSTRVATLMLGNEGSNRRFPSIGVNDGHHQLSHHKKIEEKMAKIALIDHYLAEQFAYFVQRLKATPDGEGTLLDNCAVMYGGAISDGNRHNHNDLPILLAGRGGGAFDPGRHVKAKPHTPLCNLFLSMFDAAGVPAERFGDSTGRLTTLGS